MIFKKPDNIRYTDMAIWIDNNAYEEDCDDNKLYQYIFFLVDLFAHKHRFFKRAERFDDFALFASTYLFHRIRENKDESKKITSILNYIKSCVYGLKVNFEKSEFSTLSIEDSNIANQGLSVDTENMLSSYRSAHDYNECEFSMCIEDMPKCVWETCKRTPYYSDKELFIGLYTSVLLTILNQITLPNKVAQKMVSDGYKVYSREKYIENVYELNDPLSTVVLYDVPFSMREYVLFLVNRSKQAMSRDLSAIIQSWEPSDAVVENILMDQVNLIIGDCDDN